MLEFILLSVAWFACGYFGGRWLMRKGYTLDGLDAIRDEMFVNKQVYEIHPDAQANISSSSMPLFAVGGVITLLIALIIRPKQRHGL